MKTKLFMTMAAAALVLAGCSNDETEGIDNWNGEIRLTSGIEVQTRATHTLDEALKEGEEVHVWVDGATASENLYENNILTLGVGGALSEGTAMYYPTVGNVNIYALHTNATWSGNTYPETEMTHTVKADQQSTVTAAGEGYQGSDLVYVKAANVQRSSNAVNLTFKHLLSKIEVVLKEGTGTTGFLTSDKIQSVRILNTLPNANFTLAKANAPENMTVTAAGTIAPITIDKGVTAGGTEVLNEAIIVPQTLSSGTKFIQITLNSGAVFTYSLPKETILLSGKKYKYNITVNHTGLSVTSTITGWGTEPNTGDDDGKAVMD